MVSIKFYLISSWYLILPKAAHVVPEWIQSYLVKGELTPDILDVLRLQTRSLQVCVGSAELPSAHETSKPLRQVMYGLLVPCKQVLEKDRVGLHAEEIGVQPVIPATLKTLSLLLLPKVIQLTFSKAECLNAFSEGVSCRSTFCRRSTVGGFRHCCKCLT